MIAVYFLIFFQKNFLLFWTVFYLKRCWAVSFTLWMIYSFLAFLFSWLFYPLGLAFLSLGFFISWLFYLLAFLSLGFLFSWLFNLLFSKENYQRYQINSPQSKMSKIQGLLFQKIFQQGMSMNDAENFLTLHSNIMCCRPTILCRMYAGKREKIIINSNNPHTYWIFFINKQGNKTLSQEKVKIFKLVTTLIDLRHKNDW